MNVAFAIARRLSLGHHSETGMRHRSPAVTIAIVGIALSVAIMMVTLAVVPGFKHQITRKVMGFDAQVTITPVAPVVSVTGDPGASLSLTPELTSMIDRVLPQGARVEPTARIPGILKTDDQFQGLVFKAYGSSLDGSIVAENLVAGTIPDFSSDSVANQVVISEIVSRALNIGVDDKVYGYFFVGDKLRARRFTVAGIYNSHFNEYDKLLAFMPLSTARTLMSLDPEESTAIEISGLNSNVILDVKESLSEATNRAFAEGTTRQYLQVTDVYEKDPMYFNWLDLLDTNVVVILVLMGCVAGVTLISCLFIMILERVKLIGTLKALGADNPLVARVFLFMAQRVLLRGILVGDAVALFLVWLQWQWHLLPLDPEAYYLNSVPVEFNWVGFAVLNVAAILLALLIMIIPAMTVARIAPAKVMRFE